MSRPPPTSWYRHVTMCDQPAVRKQGNCKENELMTRVMHRREVADPDEHKSTYDAGYVINVQNTNAA